ncbi:zonadhesin-like [Vanessa atalanta]|uniref:zonadhesin-like n=1 Tax=Vanessa atalanta TaxID=42275 RepID=UPI001FCDC7A6|nr:zonadhesin-like [Vanessa atalanta]
MFVFFVIFISASFFISEGQSLSPPASFDYDEPIYENDNSRLTSSFSSASSSSQSSSSSSSSSFAYTSSSSSSPDSPSESLCDCTPTCSTPNPPNCPQTLSSTPDPCKCESGYILSEKGGQCVKIEECKKYSKCNGDRNASYTACPRQCVSTCSNPNGTCKPQCENYGCQCNPLYVLSEEGQCISPDDCPGGNPCGQNKTFVYCNAGCPRNYCPENDNRGFIACSPPYPCPSGCFCKANYKILSLTDNRCILASECPPVNCTRPNEVWNSCPPPCFSESCRGLSQPPQECIRSGPDCQPQCVCKDGYRRNDDDVCVPVTDCGCPVNEEFYTCSLAKCGKTCEDLINPPPCPSISSDCFLPSCECKDGYLRNKNGICVPYSEC